MTEATKRYTNKEIETLIDNQLRETFKDCNLNKYANIFANRANDDIHKKIKYIMTGQDILNESYLSLNAQILPNLPFEDRQIIPLKLLDEEISNLYMMELLGALYSSFSMSHGYNKWFKDYELEETDVLEVARHHLLPQVHLLQMLCAQNIVEMAKYVAESLNGKSVVEANKNNKAIINMFTDKEITQYAIAKHTTCHEKIGFLKELEISSNEERFQKTTIYKNMSVYFREIIQVCKVLAEIAKQWEQQKYFYHIE